MAKLAILGFGTVGSGVLEVLQRNEAGVARRLGEKLSVGYICDVRDFSSHPNADVFVNSIEPILADSSVDIVVETIGGLTPAYDYVSRALNAGKHVVTSNKELVATHGAELLAAAKQKGISFLFEASVGGGTPIITPMHQCLAANQISAVAGIVNGTTNFMLTRMEKSGLTFESALAEAQALGYAETIDPSYDVDGIDAGRKIAILGSLAFGSHIHPQNVSARGIRSISPADMQAAATAGYAIKLVAYAQQAQEGELTIGVEPMMIPRTNRLAGVEDVFNAVSIDGDMLGEVVFYGKGAGKLPTASAVVADAIDALKEGARIHSSLFWQPSKAIEGQYPTYNAATYYVRAKDAAAAQALQQLQGAVPQAGGAVMLTQQSLQQWQATLQSLEDQGHGPAAWLKVWQ